MSATQRHALVDLTDSELAAPLRGGEAAEDELAELYARHHAAVRAYARSHCRDPHTADDIASEAFTRTIEATRRGGGPQGPWHPYLLTAVRRIALDWAVINRRALPSDQLQDEVDDALTGEELALSREEGALVVRSFRQLPERWQTVLWYTSVNGEPLAKVAARMGISESGAASLADRAREGLREAYLSVHAHGDGGGEQCGRFSGLLAAAVRRRRRPGRDLKRHLADCARCRRALLDLTDINGRLRVVLPGAILFGVGARLAAGAGAGATKGTSAAALSTPASSWHALPVAKTAMSVGAATSLAVGAYFVLTPYEVPQTRPYASPRASAPVTPSSVPPPSPSSPPVSVPPSLPGLVVGPHAVLRVTTSGDCLEPVSASAGFLREAGCDGGAHQDWVETHVLGSQVLLHNSATGLCLRDSGKGSGPDAQAHCDSGDPRQVWEVRFSLELESMVVVGRSGQTYRA
ncbi:sigma-70 family RNA polymerase sigma factor [Streptomyces sp. NPDC051976]|uniref:sigma-70 family RNA polymerase sigma factor n=1 Tax=Streptomyces sp. NPDC051976 TaxID=3154947 RepID=UPI003431E2F0